MLKQRLFAAGVQAFPAVKGCTAGICCAGGGWCSLRRQLPGLLCRIAIQHVDGEPVPPLHHPRAPVLLQRGGWVCLRMISGYQRPQQLLAHGVAGRPLGDREQTVQMDTRRGSGMQHLRAVRSAGAQKKAWRGRGGARVAHGGTSSVKSGGNA